MKFHLLVLYSVSAMAWQKINPRFAETEMETSRFTHINTSFTCEYCQGLVQPLRVGCRNHCPFCLSSKHVDHFPGDRANDCHGQLRAVSYEMHSKKGLLLTFQCEQCGFKGRNKAACDDPVQPDDYDRILKLSAD